MKHERNIGILTGGGDVPGLNRVIKTVTRRALKENIKVIGIKSGWAGLAYMNPDNKEIDKEHAEILDDVCYKNLLRGADRRGGTVLYTSRFNPLNIQDNDSEEIVDLKIFRPDIKIPGKDEKPLDMTPDILKNLEKLEIQALISVGGDDTLGYAFHLSKLGFKVIGIPKTMDGDVFGTNYCLGFSTAIDRATKIIDDLRSPMGSSKRIGVIETFGRNSGFTALSAAMSADPDRLLIPEAEFNLDKLVDFLVEDRYNNPSHYSIVLVSEGVKLEGRTINSGKTDNFKHPKLGGVGEEIAKYIHKKTHRKILYRDLTYELRAGSPEAEDRIAALKYGNRAMKALLEGSYGFMTSIDNIYKDEAILVPLELVINSPKKVDVESSYDLDQYRPLD